MKRILDNTSEYHKLHRAERVRLKTDRADVYKLAHGGSEAIIRDLALDPVGNFPMVYVQWDKDHWLYNGELDMWTFEDHFEPVEEESVSEDKNSLANLARQFADQFAEFVAQGVEKEEPKPEKKIEEKLVKDQYKFAPASGEEYLDTLSNATELASNAEGFVLLTLVPIEGVIKDRTMLVPQMFASFQNEGASYALQIGMSELVASFLTEALTRLSQRSSDDS